MMRLRRRKRNFVGGVPRGHLAEYEPGLGDPSDQVRVPGGIDPIGATGLGLFPRGPGYGLRARRSKSSLPNVLRPYSVPEASGP